MTNQPQQSADIEKEAEKYPENLRHFIRIMETQKLELTQERHKTEQLQAELNASRDALQEVVNYRCPDKDFFACGVRLGWWKEGDEVAKSFVWQLEQINRHKTEEANRDRDVYKASMEVHLKALTLAEERLGKAVATLEWYAEFDSIGDDGEGNECNLGDKAKQTLANLRGGQQ